MSQEFQMQPKSMSATTRITMLVAALVVVAAGCSTAGESSTTTTSAQPSTTTPSEAPPDSSTSTSIADGLRVGVGVDAGSKVIRLGILADLTGPFAALVTDAAAAQEAYWRQVNETGGIDGWTVDLVVADTNLSVERHREAYEAMRGDVLAISSSTGSSTNLELLPDYIEDEMLVIPLSWYSGWAFRQVDQGVIFEQNTNYCIDAMNVLEFIDGMGAQTVAVAAFDDAYGRDATAGVRRGAEFYGMTVVYEGIALPGQDTTALVKDIFDSGADWTFLATNASVGSEIILSAVQSGYEGRFIGPQPSYDFRLLDSPAASLYDSVFYQSGYTVAWGNRAPGNMEMMRAMADAFPDRRPADTYIVGWNEAVAMQRVLETAIRAGDLTRRGVVRAANSLDGISFGGSSPDQSYIGAPADFVQRASAIFKPDLATYMAAGGVTQTLSQPNATTGSVLVRDFFVSEAASEFGFTQPCAG